MSGTVFEVPALSRRKIRQYAQVIRQITGQSSPYFDVCRVCELVLPKLIPGFIFDVVGISEMGNKHGETIPAENLMRIREDVYEAAVAGDGRDRLTIAHEIGHLVLHDEVGFARVVDQGMVPAYRSSEWQANCFGGELLVDVRHVRVTDCMGETMERFGVSLTAADKQLSEYRKEGLI